MKKQQAMVLVTTMQLSVVMLMFVGAALALGPASLSASQTTLHQGHAQRACESGITYALAQLREDSAWRGNKNGVTVNRNDLFVHEDRGNVIGLVRLPNGEWSQFRLRFNYQDGGNDGEGEDQLANPSQYTLDLPFVSVNNLLGSANLPVPRADGAGASVTPTSTRPHSVPVWAVSLAVEGKAGPGCKVLSPNDPNAKITNLVSRKVVEAIYQVPDMGQPVEESGSMSGGNFGVQLRPGTSGKVVVKSKAKNDVPRVRAKGAVQVKDGDPSKAYDSEGEVKTQDGTLDAEFDETKVTRAVEKPTDPFFQMAWNDVKKADPAGPITPAGTYVWWDDGTLHYYDMSYADYQAFISVAANANNPGVTPAPLPPEIKTDPSKYRLELRESVYVKPTKSGTKEFNVIPRRGAPQLPPTDPEAAGTTNVDPVALGSGLTSAEFWDSATGKFDYADNGAPEVGVLLDKVAQFQGQTGDWSLSSNLTMQRGANSRDREFITSTGTQSQLEQEIKTSFVADMMNYLTDANTVLTPEDLQALDTLGVTGVGNGVISPPGVTDDLTAADLEIEFKPAKGSSVVLTSEGDVRLTGSLKGTAASITSGGGITVTGMGSEFSATSNPEESVNMYAVGDIRFSTMDEVNPGEYKFHDVKLKGVVYTQGDFVALLGSKELSGEWGKFNLEGILIAYGGDPSNPLGKPGDNGKGHVDLRVEDAEILFDPVYLGGLSNKKLPAGFKLAPMSWNNNL